MSRIRSIHPGLWTDDAFMGLSPYARLLVIGLWTEAFDDGVFEWKPRTLKARIFPGDDVDVSALMAELIAADFVADTEFEGRPIGVIRNFRTYQRPKKPNSSGMLKAEWRTYVGLSDGGTEEVPHQDGTDTPKPPQMEDGGGRMEDEDIEPPASVVRPGAREFEELLEVFPRNHQCSDTRAEAAWRATKAKERPAILAAAHRRAAWFLEQCEERGRTPDAGRHFEPFIATWIESGDWRKPLVLKADANTPDPNIVMLSRTDPVIPVLERKRGKTFLPEDVIGPRIAAKLADVEAARAELAA